jgi:hypothetical protein
MGRELCRIVLVLNFFILAIDCRVRTSRQRFGGRLPRLRGIPPLSCAFESPQFMGPALMKDARRTSNNSKKSVGNESSVGAPCL